jgi:hypothetical protein
MPLGTPTNQSPNADLPKRQAPKSNTPTPTTQTPPPRDPFTPNPTFSGTPNPSSGWEGDTRPSGDGVGGFLSNVANDSLDYWGAPTTRTKVSDTYTQQYGEDAVRRAQMSGLDPEVYFDENLTDKTRAIIDQWGTNLPNAGDIIAEQKQQYDQQQAQYDRDDAYMETFDAYAQGQQADRDNNYSNQAGNAGARHTLALDELNQGFGVDMGLLGERKYRDVDLARNDNRNDIGYLNTMRGITDQREGLTGQQFATDQGLNRQNWDELQTQKGTAYDRFMGNDAYMAGQAQDNASQYGFTARQYDQDVQGAFSQRETQNRANMSAAAGAGAFGSAGTRDNRGDIMEQYGQSVTSSGLTMDRQNQQTDEQDRAIGQSRNMNNLGYQDTQSGFRGQENQLQHQRTSQGNAYNQDLQGYAATRAGYNRDGSRLENVGKGLDSLAKEYGLKGQDIENQFQSAVTAAGLDLNEVNQRLERELNSGNAEAAQRATQFMYQMMSMQ